MGNSEVGPKSGCRFGARGLFFQLGRCADFGLQRATVLVTRELAYFSCARVALPREPILDNVSVLVWVPFFFQLVLL